MDRKQEEADKVEEQGSKTPAKRRGRPPLSRSPASRETPSLPPSERRQRGRPPLSRSSSRRGRHSLSAPEPRKSRGPQFSQSPPGREIQSLSHPEPRKRGRPPLAGSTPAREMQSLSPFVPCERGRPMQPPSPPEPSKEKGRPQNQTHESPRPLADHHCHLEHAAAECDRFGFLVEPGSLVENTTRCLVETDGERNADTGVNNGRNRDEDHRELAITIFQDVTKGSEFLSPVEGVQEYAEPEKPKSLVTERVEFIDQMVKDGLAIISLPDIDVVADNQNMPNHVEDTFASVGEPVNSTEQQDAQDLPFVKCSPVWRFIELMDVFKKFPQRPHFRPLVDHSEDTREGAAIAKILHFASLTEDISNLTENTSQESVKSVTRELAGFGELGFDVETAQARLSEWLATRAEVKELEAAWSRVDFHATWSSDRALKMDGKISEIDKRVEVLEKRRAALMSKSADIDVKISELQAEVARTRQAIQRRQ